MADDRAERQARRAQKYAEVRQRLEADMKASTDFIFGNAQAPAQPRQWGQRQAARAQELDPMAIAGNAPNQDAFVRARQANRNALAVLNGIDDLGPDNFVAPVPGGVPALRPQQGGVRARGRAIQANHGVRRRAVPDTEANQQATYVVCPSCFRPVLLSQMDLHTATECTAVSNQTAAVGGHGPPSDAAAGPVQQEVVDQGERERQAVESQAIAPDAQVTDGQANVHDDRVARREAAAAAALRRAEESAAAQEQAETGSAREEDAEAGAAFPSPRPEDEARDREQEDVGGADETQFGDAQAAAGGGAAGGDGETGAGVCVICMEEGEEGAGIWCAEGEHWACDGCFEEHVKTQAQELAGVRQRGGRVRCPLEKHGCSEASYPHTEVGRHVTEAAFALYMRGFELAVEARVVEEVERHLKGRGGAEAAGAASGEGREAGGSAGEGPSLQQLAALRHHVVERILTLACPRCSQAFVDFDGCCALSCPRCKCGFCAYCLQDCGGDAHGHVGRCQWNPRREVFARRERFEVAQHQRRLRMLRAFVAGLDPQVRRRVVEFCARELGDLSIPVEDVL